MLLHRLCRISLVFFILTGMTACGGGSGGGSASTPSSEPKPQPEPELIEQLLTFVDPGPVDLYVGDTFSNPATGEGTGAITYSSSNDSTVHVNHDGLLTVRTAGSATINAEIAADQQYKSAAASFTVSASLRPNTLIFQQTGPVELEPGSSFDNPASGNGSGQIQYLSSNEQVAKVDANGTVLTSGRGAATIAAIQAADSTYEEASNSYQIEVKGRSNSLSLSQDGPVILQVGEQVENPATGEGSGAIGYQSSDSTVALVDGDGNATLISPGSALITATQAADSEYTQATASYAIQAKVSMEAWMGRDDTLVTFPEAAKNLEVRRTREFVCGLACSDMESDILSNEPVVDSRASLSQTAYYHLINGAHRASITASQGRFPGRDHHQVANFKGKLWLVGGRLSENRYASDVWSSSDGVTWDLELLNAPFGHAREHKLLVQDERLWLIGGTYREDIWSSEDGVNWEPVADTVPFSWQSRPLAAVAGEKIWLIERPNSNTEVCRIWSSDSGAEWKLEREASDLPKEGLHKLVVFKDKLLLFTTGGIWSSTDAINWQLVREEPEYYSGWERQEIVEHKNKLWLIEAPTSRISRPVWYSDDGLNWTRANEYPGIPDTRGTQLVSFGDHMFLIGGDGPYTRWHNYIWGSTDGVHWDAKERSSAGLPRLYGHRAFIFNGSAHIYTGSNRNPILKSDDGINWSVVASEVPFSARNHYQLAVFKDKIFIIGGYSDGKYLNEIWSSPDGIEWTLVTEMASFSPRTHHQVVEHNGKLWLIGGQESCGSYSCYRTDIWSSADGINWTQEKDESEFKRNYRSYHKVISHNGKLWLLGDTYNNDVWYSEDALTWVEATPKAEFSPRSYYQAWSQSGSLWLAGGTEGGDFSVTNDVWRSDDGITWTEVTPNAAFEPRQRHQILKFDGALWLTGGGQVTGHGDTWRSEDGQGWRKLYRRDFVFSLEE